MKMSKCLSLAPLLCAAACVVPQARYDRLQTEYHAENQARRQLEDEVQRKDGEVSDLRSKANEKDSALSELQKTTEEDKTRIAQLQTALDEARKAMGATPEGQNGVEVYRDREGIVYRMSDQLLFESGSTDVREAGKKALAKIAAQFKEKNYPEIRIEGHTDSDPVVRTKEKFPLGNHELAMERALAVYAILVNEDKINSNVLSLAAFGPNHPVAKGESDGAKAKNRRVEIHVAIPAKG
jgi:chemotaxis protein MotB